MLELLILRHAKSSWANPGMRDHQRPLNTRGRLAAARMGQLIVEQELLPELILSSDSTRTKETVKIFSESSGFNGPTRFLNELYHASRECLIEATSYGQDFKRIMLVAHNPGLEDLVEHLGGRFEIFPTAALAHVRLTAEKWDEPDALENAEILNLWRPKNLPD